MSIQRKSNQLKHSRLCARVVRKLRAAGLSLPEPDDHYALQGQAPGYWQKASGAWAWELYVNDVGGWRPTSIGSIETATELGRKDRKAAYYVHNGDAHVTPEIVKEKP